MKNNIPFGMRWTTYNQFIFKKQQGNIKYYHIIAGMHNILNFMKQHL